MKTIHFSILKIIISENIHTGIINYKYSEKNAYFILFLVPNSYPCSLKINSSQNITKYNPNVITRSYKLLPHCFENIWTQIHIIGLFNWLHTVWEKGVVYFLQSHSLKHTYLQKSSGRCLTNNHLHSETPQLIPQLVERRSREWLGQCIYNYSIPPCSTAVLPAALQLQEFTNGDCVKADKNKSLFEQVWLCGHDWHLEGNFGQKPWMLCHDPASQRMTPAGEGLALGLSRGFTKVLQ